MREKSESIFHTKILAQLMSGERHIEGFHPSIAYIMQDRIKPTIIYTLLLIFPFIILNWIISMGAST